MLISYENKVALVTGAGQGIGLAAAQAFAEAGASVVLADVNEAAVCAAAAALVSAGRKAIAVHCDVTDDGQVAAMIDRTIKTYGRLDAAFNNAGIQTPQTPAAEMSNADFDRTITINLRGVWNCMKYEIPHMLKQGEGAIVNTSSQGGMTGFPGQAAYIASKHGVIGLTRTAALDYAQNGIRVNAICPGAIRTPMAEALLKGNTEIEAALVKSIPIGRLGKSEEIANAVLWLCSPWASFVLGHALVVDGGFTVW
ncbi:MAG: oxidoreductase [Candidatus Desulfovibrio kirbyi]|jgi:NAD(P)-dependent dehydrogenase (short-subunit alcohol dehydrogenase family)|uniref:Oxidoreductase n=1 Tax=Candidatus Desulfovibrio kirbyi TaxID=2696086 RepID=A0A6L2R7I4_9BACT|nr:MAG: oxidoreductase [Candidatus Desulfovibrio kirbyi]